jgi:hypothetical protein
VKDTSIDGAIRKALASHKNAGAEPCPDESVLAAYLEMQLEAAERQGVERHASDCASCRQTIGLALQLYGPEGESPSPRPEVASGKRVLFHVSLPFSMAVMFLLALLAGVLFYRVLREPGRILTEHQTAELRPPAQAEGISAARTPVESRPKETPAGRMSAPAAADEIRGRASKPAAGVMPPTLKNKDAAPAPEEKSVSTAGRAADKKEIPTENRFADKGLPSLPQTEAPAAETLQAVEREVGGTAADRKGIVPAAATPGAESGLTRLSGASPVPAMRVHAVSLEPGPSPPTAVTSFARMAPSRREELVRKKISDRTFYFDSGYWIDLRCAERPEVPYIEVKSGEAEYLQILKALPELEKLRPAVVYWNGRNCILR